MDKIIRGTEIIKNENGAICTDSGEIEIRLIDLRTIEFKYYYAKKLATNSGANGIASEGKLYKQEPLSNTQILVPATVFVKGGTFTMGCTKEGSDWCRDYSQPVHKVIINDFRIGKYEVTVEQYFQFCSETKMNLPYWLVNISDFQITDVGLKNIGYENTNIKNLPIVGISWNNASAYCRWLSQKTGKNYRLPTEAEWEYAARGGIYSKGYKYSGSNEIDEIAWYDGNSNRKIHEVGSKKPNELGLYDISGNLHEFCEDFYDENYYHRSTLTNPKGPNSGDRRTIRGGSYDNSKNWSLIYDRSDVIPTIRNQNLGFRIVLEE